MLPFVQGWPFPLQKCWGIFSTFPWNIRVEYVYMSCNHLCMYIKKSVVKTEVFSRKFCLNGLILLSMLVYRRLFHILTSSNRIIYWVTGPLWEEFTGHRGILLPKASDGELWWFFICSWTNNWVNNRDAEDLRPHRTQYDVNVMHRQQHSFYKFNWVYDRHTSTPLIGSCCTAYGLKSHGSIVSHIDLPYITPIWFIIGIIQDCYFYDQQYNWPWWNPRYLFSHYINLCM